MREQLQRSLSVREQQRAIIEARQKGTGSGQKSTPPDHTGEGNGSLFRPTKTPGTSRRKGPPPGLSINAPSHDVFANERVIQSAPLNQTFTGLNRGGPPSYQTGRKPAFVPFGHLAYPPRPRHANEHRLPPISDVFPSDNFHNGPQSSRAANFPQNNSNNSPGHSSHSNVQPPMPSPGLPATQQHQQGFSSTSHGHYPAPPGRSREYKSAEDALNNLSGGRDDLLPRIVHYGGHQPPTPPSPCHRTRSATAPRTPCTGTASADRGLSRRRRPRRV